MRQSQQPAAMATSLTTILRQIALGIAEAQSALDAQADVQAAQRATSEALGAMPVIAFHFPEVEIDVQLAVSVGQRGSTGLVVSPVNPISSSFFRTSSFQSRLRAKISPYLLIAKTAGVET